MKINTQAALAKSTPLAPFTYEAKPLLHDQVAIKITHCGICHSDLHLINNDWGNSSYPLVPGHEIVGTVAELGESVKHFKIGQRVGVGWQCWSCGHCEWCMAGEENLCPKQQATCIGNFGGYADTIQVNNRFVFPIPDSLSSAAVAPLLCGGATVYAPLRRFVNYPGQRVAILGIGGLGHLAIQFANALGCDVTAISTSANKKAEAEKLGAHHFLVESDEAALKQANNSFDLILSTVSQPIHWENYLKLLRPKGVLCCVGAPPAAISFPIFSLILERKSIAGSNIASPHIINAMLKFAALHNIGAVVETLPMSEVNTALDKVRNNQARYRMVLINS